MDAKITNSNENKANPVNYSTQGFTGDPKTIEQYSVKERRMDIARQRPPANREIRNNKTPSQCNKGLGRLSRHCEGSSFDKR